MSDPVLDDLKSQVRARRVIAVVGSGTSIAATRNAETSSWQGLLRHGVERCVRLDQALAGEWQARTIADVTSPRMDDLLAGASKVARTLRRQGEFARWLSDAFEGLEAKDPGVLDALGGLDAPILTTNYDDLLERRLGRVPVTLKDRTEQIAFARLESRDALLHVHGHWRHPETIVMDLSDYERVVRDQLAQTGLRTMGAAWSFLFIGCGDGLADPNFEQFLDWMSDVLCGSRHRHFRLERASAVASRQGWHNQRGHRIRVLSHGEEHRDLEGFLAGLSPLANRSVSELVQVRGSEAPARRPVLSSGEYIRLQERGRSAVQKLISLASQLGFKSIASHAAEISQALEEQPYRVAITGRSRAGKSTLVNALVGKRLCPVERTLTTAIPIVIGPGEHEAAYIAFEDNSRPELQLDGPITADVLAPYASQHHNPGNEKRIASIRVQLADEVLDLGVEYVDIPGLDDPSQMIWSATTEVISSAHALVLVLDVSTYDSGGFALDKATREVLELCQRRACPVLVVCNKGDRLASSDRADAVKHLSAELSRLGVMGPIRRPPFVVSAREAADARLKQESAPRPMADFEAALWEELWNAESVGLRRLHRVFDALRVADEEVGTLMRVRCAREPERELLRDALAACRGDLQRIRAHSAAETEKLRSRAKADLSSAHHEYLRAAADHVSSLPESPLPSVSATLAALKGRLDAACRPALDQCGQEVSARYRNTERAVSKSLSRLRETACPDMQSTDARATLATLQNLVEGIAVPGSGDDERALRVATAGVGTFAAIGLAVGGPLGWMAAGAVGLLVSAIVDQVTDAADTREELHRRVVKHATESLAALRRDLDEVVVNAGKALDDHIRSRMEPFLEDMEARLVAIREPTREENSLHEEVRRTSNEALELLARALAEAPRSDGAVFTATHLGGATGEGTGGN